MLIDTSLDYPECPPFNPPDEYPESPFKSGIDKRNVVYPSVRKIFALMNLDIRNFGTSIWSPLSEVIRKGDTVFIKPNLVFDKNLSGDSVFAVITHASLVRIMIDYAYKAAGDDGKIVVADAPQQDANFETIMEITGLKKTVEYLRDNFSVPIELYDLRKEQVTFKDGVITERVVLSGDPKGYIEVDLAKESKVADIESDFEKFYGADYNRKETALFHSKGRHIYDISRTFLESDVIINLPKLKTHMKAGITVSLKNMIGIIGEKNCIVHYRVGSPSKGGDEFPEPRSKFNALLLKFNRVYSDLLLSRDLGIYPYRILIKLGGGKSKFGSESGKSNLIHSGNWHGNDTIWRFILDINKIALFADKEGQIHNTPQRRMITLVDGIIGGEGQGPLAPKAKRCGTIMSGYDSWKIDLVATRLMGFDERKIALFAAGEFFPSNDITVSLFKNGNLEALESGSDLPNLHFKPPKTWNTICLCETSFQGNGQ